MIRRIPFITIIMVFFVFSLIAQNKDGYSHVGMDGLLLAEKDTWYLEEFDHAGRPYKSVRWEKGVISETTSWLYFGDSQNVFQCRVKSEQSSTKTEYDNSGNIVSIKETILEKKDKKTDADKTIAPVTTDRVFTYSYDSQNRLRESVIKRDGFLQKVLFDYREDGSLSKKSVFKDGALTVIYAYLDEENWTETVYYNDLAMLTVVFQNGVRQRIQHETW